MVLRDRSEFPKTAQFKVNIVLQVGAYFKRYSSASFQMLSGQTDGKVNTVTLAHALRVNDSYNLNQPFTIKMVNFC